MNRRPRSLSLSPINPRPAIPIHATPARPEPQNRPTRRNSMGFVPKLETIYEDEFGDEIETLFH